MKKLLFILLTLFSLHSFAQDTTYVKVRGIPGAYNFSKSGDSLIFYVAGVRHALSVGSTVDLSNYYNKSQTNALIPVNVSQLANDAGYINSAAIAGKTNNSDTADMLNPYLSKVLAASMYALLGSSYTKAEANSLLAGKANDNSVVKISTDQIVTGKKQFQNGAASGTIMIGGDLNATTVTNGVRKLARVTMPSWDAGTPVMLFAGDISTSAINSVYFGGSPSASIRSATEIHFMASSSPTNVGDAQDILLIDATGSYAKVASNASGDFVTRNSGNGKLSYRTAANTLSDIGAEPSFSKNTAFNKNFGIAAGNVMDAGRIIDSLAAANARIKSKLDTSYRDPVILKYPLQASLQNDTTVFSIPQTYLDSLLKTTDSLGIGGAALEAGITAYSKDKATHTIFGGDNGRSITSTGTLELTANQINLNSTSTNITPGYVIRYDVPDYGNTFDTYINGSYRQVTEVNKGVIMRLDTMRHFTPTSLNKSYTQYNSGADSVTADIDAGNMITILNQSTALKIKNPVGNPDNGQQLLFQISDNGTARAITWGDKFGFDATDAPMPTTTITTKFIYVDCIWNEDAGKWYILSVKNRDR